MSSTNEELSPPPKPRTSPLDYRNTDLVSRLLAATPPYLYNMPLVPHSYFFSEMLRSFVQAKAQENRSAIASANGNQTHNPANNPATLLLSNNANNLSQHRRSRKRGWTQMKSSSNDTWQKQNNEPLPHKDDLGLSSPWSSAAKLSPTQMEQRKSPLLEKPLELTINKLTNNNKITHKISDLEKSSTNQETQKDQNELPDIPHHSIPTNPTQIPGFPSNLLPPTSGSETTPGNIQTDLMLPPPPPIWYPPIYPSPYGIDPLHFFIDLRVSGHIYDRKKEANLTTVPPVPPPQPPTSTTNYLSNPEPQTKTEFQSINELTNENNSTFKQTRHTSAFSVPIRNGNNSGPINLSNGAGIKEDVQKFGGELLTTLKTENHNKVSTHYVMQNLQKVYNKILEKQSELVVAMDDEKIKVHAPDGSSAASIISSSSITSDTKRNNSSNPCSDDNLSDTSTIEYQSNENSDEMSSDGGKMAKKNSNCKDLSALIGLELVVDYVKHEKPRTTSAKNESTTNNNNNEPIRVDSPDLEIVETQHSN